MILQNSIVEKAINAHLTPVFFMMGEYMLYDIVVFGLEVSNQI